MSIENIKQEIRDEIQKLQQALKVLDGISVQRTGASSTAGKSGRRRGISAAGRARIAAAQRARWAKIRAAKKK